MNANGGLGTVIQKNIQLESFIVVDGIQAIKHGNGRDYWLIIRNASVNSNEHYLYLISPAGISSPIILNVGSVNSTNAGRHVFSPDGSKLAYVNLMGLMELYEFDRCNGTIINPVTFHPQSFNPPYGRFVSCEFSPNGRFLYASSYSDTCKLYQYDLQSANPAADRVLLDSIPNYLIGMGFLKIAPDNKIYLSMAYECDASPDCHPYPDSVYNNVNMNLSVINYPDSLGIACGYSPFSFYLGGKKTYYGLPNNPDYDLGLLIGSPCDTIVSIPEPQPTSANFYIYYSPQWQSAFINADKLQGRTYQLMVLDAMGREVHSESGSLTSPYFTRNLNCGGFAKGMYVVVLESDKEKLVKKFVVE